MSETEGVILPLAGAGIRGLAEQGQPGNGSGGLWPPPVDSAPALLSSGVLL